MENAPYGKCQMLSPEVMFLWSCLSPGTSVVLVHSDNVSELWIRSQNPSSKSHLLYLEPPLENSNTFTVLLLSLGLFCVSP